LNRKVSGRFAPYGPGVELVKGRAMPKHWCRRVALLVSAAVFVAGPLGEVAGAGRPDRADATGAVERDVFEVIGRSLRNPVATSDPDAFLYNVAGLRLPVTWGEWSAASATSRASTIGGRDGPRTDFRISFHGLIPEGVYSVFFFTIGPDTEQRLCPGVERMLPLDAARPEAQVPDRNSFAVDRTGSAEFHGRIEGDLLAADQLYVTAVYHADGQTYYPFPNRGESLTQGENCRSSFGHDAMRHLLILQKTV
jgi:hypothetical protein